MVITIKNNYLCSWFSGLCYLNDLNISFFCIFETTPTTTTTKSPEANRSERLYYRPVYRDINWQDAELANGLRKYESELDTLIPGCWEGNVTTLAVSIDWLTCSRYGSEGEGVPRYIKFSYHWKLCCIGYWIALVAARQPYRMVAFCTRISAVFSKRFLWRSVTAPSRSIVSYRWWQWSQVFIPG